MKHRWWWFLVCLASSSALADVHSERFTNLNRERAREWLTVTQSWPWERCNHSTMLLSMQQGYRLWMGLSGASRGPVETLNLAWPVEFWPDKKNRVGRQMEAMRSLWREGVNPPVPDAAVTARGYPALEWLLTQSDWSTKDCALADALAADLVNTAYTIASAWQRPQPWAEDLSGRFNYWLDQAMFFERRLNQPLAPERWRTELAAGQRSNLDMSLLRYQGQEITSGIRRTLLLQLSGEVQQNLRYQLNELDQGWPMRRDVSRLHMQSARWEALLYLLRTEVAQQLEVQTGFNASDGD